jgi:hypothetical protein
MLPVTDHEPELDPHSRPGRIGLSKMIIALFGHWQLGARDQMALLGLSEGSRTTLMRYKRGEPLADQRDLLDRVADLLAIHRSLRILFPENRDLAYRWPTMENKVFENKSPVQFIREKGFLGLITVRRYLDFERGR